MTDQELNPEPAFFAFIPAPVLYNETLEPNAKILYAHITALTRREGYCWATNRYLASLFKVDVRSVQRWLSSLEEGGFIEVEIVSGGFQTERKIWLAGSKIISTARQKCQEPPPTKMSEVAAKNVTHIDTPIDTEEKRATSVAPVPTRGARTGPPPKVPKIFFNPEKSSFDGLSEKDLELWRGAFPDVDLDAELKRIVIWCVENPEKINKRKRGLRSTITGWLGRTYDKLGDKSARQASYRSANSQNPAMSRHFGVNEAFGKPSGKRNIYRDGKWYDETTGQESGS